MKLLEQQGNASLREEGGEGGNNKRKKNRLNKNPLYAAVSGVEACVFM